MNLKLFSLCCFALLASGGAEARCRLALLLAVDVSSSVSDTEYNLQRNGLANALLSDDVQRAILDGPAGEVLLSVFEWSGRYQQDIVLDWTALDQGSTILAASQTIRNHTRAYSRYPTSMGYAVHFAVQQFKAAPHCDRTILDVSGDGINNDGFGPGMAYRHFPSDRVTVNGLAISGSDPDVLWFYETEVLHGPLAFLEIADGFEDFERAMTRKLFREIGSVMVGNSTFPAQVLPPKL